MSIHTKTHPFSARLRERVLLNPASTKETYHLVLDIADSHLPFQVGDSVGIYPDNDAQLVKAIIERLRATDTQIINDRASVPYPLREFLLRKANLCKCTSNLLKLLHERGADLSALLNDKPKSLEFLQTHHLIDILHTYPHANPSPQELCALLLPLMPRFYSIASSPKMFPHEIHLTVASLTYPTAGGLRRGVGSHFLCHYALIDTPIPLFVQPSNGFTLPSDPNASLILIGPGTGIAPFRGFLQERTFLQQKGRTWLFFGERNRATDFYYADYWLELEKQDRLRLDLAFSRDSQQKTYVQHLLWENRAAIWDWVQDGAYLYVCGDAEKMAKDVDATLLRIGRDQGALSEEAASAFFKSLRKNRRYLQDVY